MGVLRAACVQMRSGVSVEKNIVQMRDFVRDAAAQGAIYIQTPEMSGLLQKNPKLLMDTIKTARCTIRSLRPALNWPWNWVFGCILVQHRSRLADSEITKKAANRGALFSPKGELVVTYDKIHMFDVDR